MKPPWLESWLGAPLEELDAERLTQALVAARQIAERLSQQEGKATSLKGHQDLVAISAEWQEAIAELLRECASRS